MKKFFLALTALLCLIPATSFAQREMVRLTRYEGERITGVSTSFSFEVELVKSDQTKAVVEIDSALEPYLRFSISNGVVSVGIRNLSARENRTFNRLQHEIGKITTKLTLYLPELNTVRLSGVSKLTASDSFTGNNLDIRLSGSAAISGLTLSGGNCKLECSGASKADLAVRLLGDLTVSASGSSNITLAATGATTAKLSTSGAAKLQLTGDGSRQGNWNSSGSSRITADEFPVRELTVTASGAAAIRAHVAESLTTRMSGSSSVRYRGEPARLHNSNSGSSSVRPL